MVDSLAESEESYRSLFEANPHPMWVHDRETGAVLAVNGAAIATYGYTREEFLGMTVADLVSAEERAGLPAGPDTGARDERHRKKSGEVIVAATTSHAVVFGGRPARLVVADDVTLRRRVERRVAQREAYFRSLIENASDLITILDEDGVILFESPSIERVLGYRQEELVGRRCLDLIHPEDRPHVAAALERRLHEPSSGQGTRFRFRHRDGSWRTLEGVARNALGDPGIRGFVVNSRDVTGERVRDERIQLLANALEGLEDAVSIVDAEGRFVYANSAHARLYAYDPARLPELRTFDVVAGADPEAAYRELIAAAREGVWSGRARRRRVDGEELTVRALIGRIEKTDPERFLFITRDATEEMVREQHMQRTERLASMGTLLSGVAHELNNPLHAIGNFAQLLLMDPRPAQDREALEIMQREAERAGRIVQDLRIIARQSQAGPPEKDLVDVNDVVRHVLKLRRYTLETHNIRVVEQLTDDVPPVWANRPELEQVVLNLVLNAEQAMIEGAGEGRLSLRTTTTRSQVVVQIADTGPGIAPEVVGRIFDPFFTTKPPGEGTGLGLSLVHTIVTEHGGTVRVTSTPGSGAAFTVEFPRASAPEAEPASGPGCEAPCAPLRVLVVDDEAPIRRSVQLFLERRGHRVHQARNGEEALRLLERPGAAGGYDVILCDLRMPGIGGEELLAHLRVRRLAPRIVFITGDAASHDAARIRNETGIPVLMKPVKLEEIARAVEQPETRPATAG